MYNERNLVAAQFMLAWARATPQWKDGEGKPVEFEKNITEIINTTTKLVQPDQIILFGSRARGVAHRYSDYDIALVGVDMDHRTERRLKEALDERLGIFTVDLIDMSKVDPEFKEIIIRSGVVIYEN